MTTEAILSPALFDVSSCSVPVSLRVAVLDKVTDFLLFLGKLLIVGIVGRMKSFRPNMTQRDIYTEDRSVRSCD